ncbi:MAG TPA: hypothetical protein VN924_00220 [Bryobacteraceae bacterium]|nr:hypothetical protein [Bryobacteraceae bacterium]
MGAGENPHKKSEADTLQSGLDAGIVAAPNLPVWLALVMAATFCGEAVLGRDFPFRTVAGLALYQVLCGIVGALFGLGWYYLSFAILLRNINPLITLYTHRGTLMAARSEASSSNAG